MPLLADTGRKVTSIYAGHRWLPIRATRAVIVTDARGAVKFRSVMIRAFRPTDDEVLAAIHTAKYDVLANLRVAVN